MIEQPYHSGGGQGYTGDDKEDEEDRWPEQRSGGAKDFEGTGVISATVLVQVWKMHAVQACARPGTSGHACHRRILPWSLEVQVRQQVVHAMMFYI